MLLSVLTVQKIRATARLSAADSIALSEMHQMQISSSSPMGLSQASSRVRTQQPCCLETQLPDNGQSPVAREGDQKHHSC